jgi:hypothetical protein
MEQILELIWSVLRSLKRGPSGNWGAQRLPKQLETIGNHTG